MMNGGMSWEDAAETLKAARPALHALGTTPETEHPMATSLAPVLSHAFPPPASPPPMPAADIFQPLAVALVRCLAIIGAGFFCKQFSIFSQPEAAGISAFVARIALPVLVFLSIATLDVSAIEWRLVASILLGKGVVFAVVVLATFLTAAKEWGRSGRGDSLLASPMMMPVVNPLPPPPPCAALPPAAVLSAAAHPAMGGADIPIPAIAAGTAERGRADRRAWMRRAGLYAIFATQSNDFALGLPLIQAIWGSAFTSTVFIVGPGDYEDG